MDYLILAESVSFTHPAFPEPQKGAAAVRQYYETLAAAFPDGRFEKVRAFGQGDWVCVESTAAGTHEKPLQLPDGQTIPATNKAIRLPGCGVYRPEDGKVTEFHAYVDRLEMTVQLGLAP